MNREYPDVSAGLRKGGGTRDQIVNICWIIKKAREFQKNIYFSFIDYAKAFVCGITTNCGKLLRVWNTRPHYLLPEKSVGRSKSYRTRYGITDFFQIGKGHQGCILSPCLFNLYAEYIMRNARLHEAQLESRLLEKKIFTTQIITMV